VLIVFFFYLRIETEGGRSTLTIDAVQPQDSSWFQCSAANVAGTASTRGKLTVKRKSFCYDLTS
jgi:hypothetical protein